MAPSTTSAAFTETATATMTGSSPLFAQDLFASLDDASSVTTSSTSSSANASSNSTTTGKSKKNNGGGDIEYLPVEYRPSDTTVILGRGKQIKMHAGNRRLQARIQEDLAVYTAGDCHKTVKSSMVAQIVHAICAMNDDRVGFVKLDTSCKRWFQVTNLAARTTVAQAFRDANQGQHYRSSKQSKRRRRFLEKMQEVRQEVCVSQNMAAEAAVSSITIRPPPPPVAVSPSPSSSSKSLCQQQQPHQPQACVAPPQAITLQSACEDAARQVRQQLLQLQQEHLQLQMIMLQQQQQQMLLMNHQNWNQNTTNQVACDDMVSSFSNCPESIRQQYQKQQEQGLSGVTNTNNMNPSEPLLMPDTTTMIMNISNHYSNIQDSSSDRLSAILDAAVRAADAAAVETMEDDLSCGSCWEDPFEPVPIDEEAMVVTSDLFEI